MTVRGIQRPQLCSGVGRMDTRMGRGNRIGGGRKRHGDTREAVVAGREWTGSSSERVGNGVSGAQGCADGETGGEGERVRWTEREGLCNLAIPGGN